MEKLRDTSAHLVFSMCADGSNLLQVITASMTSKVQQTCNVQKSTSCLSDWQSFISNVVTKMLCQYEIIYLMGYYFYYWNFCSLCNFRIYINIWFIVTKYLFYSIWIDSLKLKMPFTLREILLYYFILKIANEFFSFLSIIKFKLLECFTMKILFCLLVNMYFLSLLIS